MKCFMVMLFVAYFNTYKVKASTCSCNAPGFVYLSDVDDSIIQDIRYYTSHNFLSRRVEGYNAPVCVLSVDAAANLSLVQHDAVAAGYSLKVYDCYRPQRAVDEFVSWSHNEMDKYSKDEFYPTLEKSDLFPDYIATKSGHSRGSTIDVTLVALPAQEQATYLPGQPLVACTEAAGLRFQDNSIDMGTGFDCLDPLANTENNKISDIQKKNRDILLNIMRKYGFENYAGEWWHFTLQNEPFPTSYFDFPIQIGCNSS